MADRPEVKTRPVTRNKLQEVFGTHELVKAFEDMVQDVSVTLPDSVVDQSDAIEAAQNTADAALEAAEDAQATADAALAAAAAAQATADAALALAGTGGGGGGYTNSETAPTSPVLGDRWYVPSTATLYTRVNDGTSDQWVEL